MANWEAEKSKLWDLSQEKWDQRIKEKNATSLDEIPTWRAYFKIKDIAKIDGGAKDPSVVLDEKVSIWQGDITKLGVDGVVNAANERLLGGGGVDGAIHRAAGPLLRKECETLNGAVAGEAKITAAYEMAAKAVIHTVGPRGEYPEKLSSCYKNSLERLTENKMRSIAFPCISTGIFGYPNENACLVALETVRKFLEENPDKVDRVIFCLFLPKDVEIYHKQMQRFFPTK